MTKQQIGLALKAAKGDLTYYKLTRLTKMPRHQLKNVENGGNYAYESLEKYADAVGLQVYLAPKPATQQ